MIITQIQSPFVLVIFGATGDLTQKKLITALFHLFDSKSLPEKFYIVGFSRRNYSQLEFKDFIFNALTKHRNELPLDENLWKNFSNKLYYQPGTFEEKAGYLELIDLLKKFDDELSACVPRFFYLATPPDKYEMILTHLHDTKLSEGCGQGSDKWTKVMIEKPFGRNLVDAKNLDMKLAQIFKEEQIFRIDHYLGKETVQNILSFRYGNTIFEPVWNSQFIDHVQITIAETVGVETRGNFYEGVGALRDMAQSHLLELMTAIAMKPMGFSSEQIRSARTKVIKSINHIEPHEVGEKTVRGQYSSQSAVGNSQLIKSYRQEPNVDANSDTETFVALKINLNDTTWQDVPFYLRTGKRLPKKVTEISVVFKKPQEKLFAALTADGNHVRPNVLTFRIEPEEGITLYLDAKEIGLTSSFRQIPLSFAYEKEKQLPEAYERLLVDAMRGDQTLYTRTDEVTAAWEFISKIEEGWKKIKPKFPNYNNGSWGPNAAQELIEKDGRYWLIK